MTRKENDTNKDLGSSELNGIKKRKKISEFEKILNKVELLPLDWKKLLVSRYKEDVGRLEESDVRGMLIVERNWLWVTKKQNVWSIMDCFFALRGAGSVLQVTQKWYALQEKEVPPRDSDEFKSARARVYVECCDLCSYDLLDSLKIPPNELGKGQRGVTIYFTEFATEKTIDKAIKWYKNKGGDLAVTKTKKEKGLSEVVKNALKSIEYAGNRARLGRNKRDFYFCRGCGYSTWREKPVGSKRRKMSPRRIECPNMNCESSSFLAEVSYEGFELLYKHYLRSEAKLIHLFQKEGFCEYCENETALCSHCLESDRYMCLDCCKLTYKIPVIINKEI